MAAINVRLGTEDARLAAELREAGASVSSIVRDAIRREHARMLGRRGKPSAIVANILKGLPDEDDSDRVHHDPHDRETVKRVITAKLQRR